MQEGQAWWGLLGGRKCGGRSGFACKTYEIHTEKKCQVIEAKYGYRLLLLAGKRPSDRTLAILAKTSSRLLLLLLSTWQLHATNLFATSPICPYSSIQEPWRELLHSRLGNQDKHAKVENGPQGGRDGHGRTTKDEGGERGEAKKVQDEEAVTYQQYLKGITAI